VVSSKTELAVLRLTTERVLTLSTESWNWAAVSPRTADSVLELITEEFLKLSAESWDWVAASPGTELEC
jgi:hypothetical protein